MPLRGLVARDSRVCHGHFASWVACQITRFRDKRELGKQNKALFGLSWTRARTLSVCKETEVRDTLESSFPYALPLSSLPLSHFLFELYRAGYF